MPASGRRQTSQGLLPVTLTAVLVYLLLIPQQFNPTVAGIYLSPYRFYLICVSVYLLGGVARQNLRFAWPDFFVIAASAWIWLASYMTSGSVQTAIVIGGSHSVDIMLAYFLVRMTIRTPDDFRYLLIMIVPGIAIVSAIVVTESVSRQLILQPLASALTGLPNPLRAEIRMGLLRGAGPFPHPILAGIFLASFISLYFLSGLRGWPRLVGIAASVGGMFTMSSAAMLGIVVGSILIFYDWLCERITNLTWRVFLFFAAILYGSVELTSNTGFYGLLIRYASLNTASAYNRVLIWEYGTDNIERSPWFGIGYADWDRPDWMHSGSFDHFWLIMALRFGIPETVMLLTATFLGLIMLATNSLRMPPRDARLVRGIAISLAVFALGVNSVSLWLSALAWYFMLLGIAVSLGMARYRA